MPQHPTTTRRLDRPLPNQGPCRHRCFPPKSQWNNQWNNQCQHHDQCRERSLDQHHNDSRSSRFRERSLDPLHNDSHSGSHNHSHSLNLSRSHGHNRNRNHNRSRFLDHNQFLGQCQCLSRYP
jgi:hypothetical protein